MRELRKRNNVGILNEFFKTDMRFMVLEVPEDEIGAFRYVSDMETGERFIFVTISPEVYEKES
jgi:hypothetical protein